MTRIAIPETIETAPAGARPHLESLKGKLGFVPNLYKLLALSPAGLDGALALSGALAKTSLEPALRERIALAVANVNGCDYCNAAHTAIAGGLKLDVSEIQAARDGHSRDSKQNAAVAFARTVAVQRGSVTQAELNTLREAGYSDAQAVEIVLVVAANVLTNYVNEVFKTTIDFPATEQAKRIA